MKPAPSSPRFSPSIFFTTWVVHIGISVLLAGASFITAMASFTESVSDRMEFLAFLGWIWTTPQMALLCSEGTFPGLQILGWITIGWSAAVAAFITLLSAWLNGASDTPPHSGHSS